MPATLTAESAAALLASRLAMTFAYDMASGASMASAERLL